MIFRPSFYLTLFAALIAMMLAMAWVTVRLLQEEKRVIEQRKHVAFRENRRLALWRLENRLAHLFQEMAAGFKTKKQPAPAFVRNWTNQIPADVVAMIERLRRNRIQHLQTFLKNGRKPQNSLDEQEFRDLLERNSRMTMVLDSPQADFCFSRNGHLYLHVSLPGAEGLAELDHEQILNDLNNHIKDLLPQASLQLVEENDWPPTRLLTAPIALVSPPIPSFYYHPVFSSTVQMLLIAWSCIFLPATGLVILFMAAVRFIQKQEFIVSAVAHELRTPLTTFRMYAEMLEDGMVPNEQLPLFYRNMHRETLRLQHLVENILTFVRIRRHHQRYLGAPLHLTRVLDEIIACWQPLIKQAGARLEVDWHTFPPEPWIQAERIGLERLFSNLIDNALKYGPSRDCQIHIRCEHRERFLIVHLRDNGPGIPEAVRKKLFTPFARDTADAQKKTAGIGLGLALCRQILRHWGATIELLDHPQQPGTHWQITFLRIEPPPEDGRSASDAERPRAFSEKDGKNGLSCENHSDRRYLPPPAPDEP